MGGRARAGLAPERRDGGALVTEVQLRQLADVLREAGTTHHKAFAATAGADPEWPTWYAEFLAPRLRAILGRSIAVDELAERLQQWRRGGVTGVLRPGPRDLTKSWQLSRPPSARRFQIDAPACLLEAVAGRSFRRFRTLAQSGESRP